MIELFHIWKQSTQRSTPANPCSYGEKQLNVGQAARHTWPTA
jgi:hypothetical protein